MPTSTRLGSLATLQNAQAGAANGTALDCEEAVALLVEVSGTYTGITANFEGSVDAGATWWTVSLAALNSTTRARSLTATANGLYLLEDIGALSQFRARTTVATPTGSMTVKARTTQVR